MNSYKNRLIMLIAVDYFIIDFFFTNEVLQSCSHSSLPQSIVLSQLRAERAA